MVTQQTFKTQTVSADFGAKAFEIDRLSLKNSH